MRDAFRADAERTLARVAEIGYREVEFAGYHRNEPRLLRAALDRFGLTAPSAHVGLEELEGDAAAATIDAARVMGHRYLIVAWTPPAWRRTLDDWRRLAARFDRAGERTRAADIQFAYHNHDAEMRPLEGRVPLDLLLEVTDRRLVQIQLDLYWTIHGGGDPLAYIRRWPGRIPSVHIKDRTRDARMVDVGDGVIDWRGILGQREAAGMRHFFVEHDEPQDAWASITRSYRYLSGLDV